MPLEFLHGQASYQSHFKSASRTFLPAGNYDNTLPSGRDKIKRSYLIDFGSIQLLFRIAKIYWSVTVAAVATFEKTCDLGETLFCRTLSDIGGRRPEAASRPNGFQFAGKAEKMPVAG
jgi:hypothetical protein